MQRQLMEDHDDLRRTMREYAAGMGAAGPVDMQDMVAKRIAFARLFRQHMAREDGLEQAATAAGVDRAGQRVIRQHRDTLRALFLRYSAHIKDWPPDQIERDWPSYRQSVLALQQELWSLMIWEERYLHPIVEGGAARQRAA